MPINTRAIHRPQRVCLNIPPQGCIVIAHPVLMQAIFRRKPLPRKPRVFVPARNRCLRLGRNALTWQQLHSADLPSLWRFDHHVIQQMRGPCAVHHQHPLPQVARDGAQF